MCDSVLEISRGVHHKTVTPGPSRCGFHLVRRELLGLPARQKLLVDHVLSVQSDHLLLGVPLQFAISVGVNDQGSLDQFAEVDGG